MWRILLPRFCQRDSFPPPVSASVQFATESPSSGDVVQCHITAAVLFARWRLCQLSFRHVDRMPSGVSRYAVRYEPVCRPVSAGMPTGLCRYADRSQPVCRPVSAGMPTGLCRYAVRSQPVCRPVSAGMPSGLSRYAVRSLPVCRPVSAGMPTGLCRYADRSQPVCRPVSAGMPTGLSRYADRSLPVCRPVSAGMPSGLSRYADRSLPVSSLLRFSRRGRYVRLGHAVRVSVVRAVHQQDEADGRSHRLQGQLGRR